MIHVGDCIEVMAGMPEASVDAVVTDPPYGLEFMGRSWDKFGDVSRANRGTQPNRKRPPGESGTSQKFQLPSPAFDLSPRALPAFQAWCEAWGREALRVTKPGGYLLAFGGTRTHHRLVCGLEDAGWIIRDELQWITAAGFPKSLDVSKALDNGERARLIQEAPPEFLARLPSNTRWDWTKGGHAPGQEWWDRVRDDLEGADDVEPHVLDYVRKAAGWFTTGDGYHETAPRSDLARKYAGYGTALKPAHEPIVLARKPLAGSVAQNVTRYGTGALNIGATRIGNGDGPGRWPSNVLLDPDHPELFDEPNPEVVGSGAVQRDGVAVNARRDGKTDNGATYGHFPKQPGPDVGYGGGGGYSRFFAIPGRGDVPETGSVGQGLQQGDGEGKSGDAEGSASDYPTAYLIPKAGREERNRGLAARSSHPTVKPVDLMRHLVRLVTPSRNEDGEPGLVLDPFLGSGSTALAAEMEGFRWIGIEKEVEYTKIAEARLNGVQKGMGLDVPAPTRKRTTKPLEHRSVKEHRRLAQSNADRPIEDLYWMMKGRQPPEEVA